MTAWTPELENNIGLWDPSVSGNITQSSNLVSQLADTSGNNKHLAQATGSLQPSTNTRTLNSLNVIDSDGTNYLAVSIVYPTTGNYMFTGVFGIDTVTNAAQAIFAAAGTNGFALDAGSASEFDARLTGVNCFTTATPSPAVAYSSATIFVVVFDFGASTVKLYTNGTLVLTATYSTKITTTSTFGVLTDRAGAQGLDGFLAYCCTCKSFSTETRQRFEGFYADRFGLTASLPSDHPYKSSAPQVVPFAADAAAVSAITADLTTGIALAADAAAVSAITADLTTASPLYTNARAKATIRAVLLGSTPSQTLLYGVSLSNQALANQALTSISL